MYNIDLWNYFANQIKFFKVKFIFSTLGNGFKILTN